jgi:hypothetical protein
MNRLHWLKTTGSFLKSRAEREIPIGELRRVQANDSSFAEILEKQKLQLRMQRE